MRHTIESLSWVLRRSLTGVLIFAFGVALFEFIQPIAIASFRELAMMQAIAAYVPPAFLAMFNMPPGFLEQASLSGFLSLGFSHPVYHLLSTAAVIWLITRTLTGEMERGAIQLALSRPVARWQVYVSRVLAMVLVAVVVPVAGSLGMIAGIAAGRPDGTVRYANFVILTIAAMMFLLCIGGVALLIAAASSRTGQAVGLSIGFLVLSFVIDYFAQLWSALKPLDPFSVFNYFEPIDALVNGTVPAVNALVLLSLAILASTCGYIVFAKRDLP